ncbi:hypothetical protein RhiLY_09559 [Ceratobasidium sp. AG-Ba]|nr:hypothetical protein RhiLY_09559 [Ceratobasidium sp. AG-Ba]
MIPALVYFPILGNSGTLPRSSDLHAFTVLVQHVRAPYSESFNLYGNRDLFISVTLAVSIYHVKPMDAPTHLDAFRALLASCLPCTNRPLALPPSPTLRPRSDDLDALLRPPSSDLENDTDAMSLHSNFGSDARARRKKKKKNGMPQLCGLNLFGKPRIALDSDDEDRPPQQHHSQPGRTSPPRVRPRYDSDAAPLPDATISSLAAGTQPQQDQPLRLEESPEEELARLRAEKAARKARRRDRRERKAAKQLALEAVGGEFEGYPGSGPGTDLPISPPSTTTSTPGLEDGDPEDGDADMGAAVYTRSNGRSSVFSGSSSGTGTSRTGRSRSGSNALGLGLHKGPPSPLGQAYVSAPPPPPPVLVDVGPKEEANVISKDEPKDQIILSSGDESATAPKDESSPSSKGKQVADTRAARPKIHISNLVSNNLPMSSPGAGPGPRTMESSPRIVAANGFPSPRITNSNNGFPSPRIGAGSGFPSPGLGLTGAGFPSPRIGGGGSGGIGAPAGFPFGPARKGSVTAGMGVALANRGD